MLENAASIQASAADDLFYSINGIMALMRAVLPMVLILFHSLILNNLVYNNYCI